jgi:hypothetical protein
MAKSLIRLHRPPRSGLGSRVARPGALQLVALARYSNAADSGEAKTWIYLVVAVSVLAVGLLGLAGRSTPNVAWPGSTQAMRGPHDRFECFGTIDVIARFEKACRPTVLRSHA